MGEQQKSFTLKKYKYLSESAHSKSHKFTKIEKIEDWENVIPSNAVIATF